MHKKLLSVAAATLTFLASFAQPAIQWQKSMGGKSLDEFYRARQTADGGYIAGGYTYSNDGDFIANTLTQPSILVKLDASGNVTWISYLTAGQAIFDVRQTADGGYICASTTMVVKTDASGVMQWQLDLSTKSVLRSILITPAGDYMAAGRDSVNDYYVLKVSTAGTLLWSTSYGGSGVDGATDIESCTDGGYILSGSTTSGDGDVTGYHGSGGNPLGGDLWAVKIDSIGSLQWERALGGSQDEFAYYSSVKQTADKGFLFCTGTDSHDGDVTGYLGGSEDAWVVKLDSTGALQWEKCFGGAGSDYCRNICLTPDGGFFMMGLSSTINNGEVAGGHGGADIWVVKADANGNFQYQKCLGGTSSDRGSSVNVTADGGCILAGATTSKNGDVTVNKGGVDAWLIKLLPVPTHIITGTVFADTNRNCIQDSLEKGLAGKAVEAQPGNYFATTDANGYYTLFVDTGLYTVSNITPVYYSQTCPGSNGTYTVNINSVTPTSYNNNFSDTLSVHCADMKINIGTAFFRRCFESTVNVSYSNIGSVTADTVTVSVTFDSLIIPLSSTVPWTKTGNTYVFKVGNVAAETSGSFNITDSVSCAAIIGMNTECVHATISTVTAECNLSNNSSYFCAYIIGSCDPNGKEVASQQETQNGFVRSENIMPTDTLSYTIHFQNIGNDTAFTVIVRDTLSPYLDAATIEPGIASAPYTYRLYENGIMEWIFDNIKLTDTLVSDLHSRGFVNFSVRQKQGNAPGTVINNNAGIWFDYNSPVYTNTTVNTIPILTSVSNTSAVVSLLGVYPNPNKGLFRLSCYGCNSASSSTLTITDITGRTVFTSVYTEQQPANIVDLSDQANGLYFVTIYNASNLYRSKLIIEK